MKRLLISAITAAALSIAAPAMASSSPYLSWSRTVRDSHIIVGHWMNEQNADWTSMTGIQDTGKDCWRGNRRTMFCVISFTGTYTDETYGISQDFQVGAVVRMYLFANGTDYYRQNGPAWETALSTPYTASTYLAKKHAKRATQALAAWPHGTTHPDHVAALTGDVRDAIPFLTMAQAHQAFIAHAQPDHAQSVTIGQCWRLSATAIRCWVDEHGVTVAVKDNGTPIHATSFNWIETARLTTTGVTVQPA